MILDTFATKNGIYEGDIFPTLRNIAKYNRELCQTILLLSLLLIISIYQATGNVQGRAILLH